jgi:hypothetical protein
MCLFIAAEEAAAEAGAVQLAGSAVPYDISKKQRYVPALCAPVKGGADVFCCTRYTPASYADGGLCFLLAAAPGEAGAI